MAKTYSAIQTITLSTTATSVTFSNIPQNYTDLKIAFSARTDTASATQVNLNLAFNGLTSSFSGKLLYGDGASAGSGSRSDNLNIALVPASTATSNTFGNSEIYIPNYTSGTNKSYSVESVSETNGTNAYAQVFAGLWSSSSNITQVTIAPNSGNFIVGSTCTIYGIGSGAKASGGTVSSDGKYMYHTFLSTGAFVPTEQIKNAEVLAVAGGGATGVRFSGGGGAGGVVYLPGNTFAAGTAYVCTVGAGGASPANNGVNSQVAALTAAVGGLSLIHI